MYRKNVCSDITLQGFSHKVTFRASTCSQVVNYDKSWLHPSAT